MRVGGEGRMARLTDTAIAELEALCPGGVVRDVDLSAISQWRIGGRADVVLRPSSSAEISSLICWFADRGDRPVVIGLTSNLLFADEGLRAPCIQIGPRMSQIWIGGTRVHAQAGVWMPGLARRLMQAGLSGIEHACGIPGTLGGLICMNGGSQRKGIGSHIISVESVDANGRAVTRTAKDCNFTYRHSLFQEADEIVTCVTLQLVPAEPTKIRSEILQILASRRSRFPRKQPNCGSTFISNPELYGSYGSPGAIIERLGFKGRKIGNAQVSDLHANFLVNTGGACARDVLHLIAEINKAARTMTGKAMLTEVRYVFPDGRIRPAGEVAGDWEHI